MPVAQVDIDGRTAEIDVPQGVDPSTYIDHAVNQIRAETKQKPGILERIGSGIVSGAEGLGQMALELPGQMASLGRTALGVAAGEPDWRRILGTLKGAGKSLSMGLYQPELTPEQTAGAPGGELAGGLAFGAGLGKAVSPLVSQLVAKLAPTIGKTAAGLVGKTAEAGAYSAPGAITAAATGQDPLEVMTAGMTATGALQTLTGLSKSAARFAATPAKQAIEKQAFNEAVRSWNYTEWQRLMDNLVQAREHNQALIKTHTEAVANAQANLLSRHEGSQLAYQRALEQLKQTQVAVKDFDTSMASRVETMRPKMTPAEAFAEYNAVLQRAPETLPSVELTKMGETTQRLGGGLLKATEELPKAAAPSGMIEKLTTGLSEAMGQEAPQYHPQVTKTFGKTWETMPAEQRTAINARYVETLGISGDDIAMLSSGTLRLDQLDRIRRLVGPHVESGNNFASQMYASLMEDLRGSSDPMAQGYYNAIALDRKHKAVTDLASRVVTVADNFGRPTVSPLQVRKIKTMFDNYDKNPNYLNWRDRLLVESIPTVERPELLKFVNEFFTKREGEATAATRVTEIKATLTQNKITIPPPKLLAEHMPSPKDMFLEQPMQYMSPSQLNAWENSVYFTLRSAGMPIPQSVALGRTAGIVTGLIFRAGVTSQGRSFVRRLYADSGVNLRDVSKIGALAQFLQTQRRAEEQQGPQGLGPR